MTNKPTELVVTQAQREAALEGRVHDCPYNHPIGTRCPNCASWPFKKGGAAAFIEQVRENHRLASTAPASEDEVERVAPKTGLHRLDADTLMSPGSLAAASRAAGAMVHAVDLVISVSHHHFRGQ